MPRVASALRLALLAGAGAAITGCADAPASRTLAAADRPQAELVSTNSLTTPIMVTGLRRSRPLSRDYTQSLTLFNTGGSIRIVEAGLQVSIPRNALPMSQKPITITVTALKGDLVAYEFGPSGTKFINPIGVTQDLTYTTWYGNTGYTLLRAEYFKDVTDLDMAHGTAVSYESLQTIATGNRLHWDVRHFSGYMVSMSRGGY